MNKKIVLKIAGYYLLVVLGLFLILVGVNWYLIKQKEARLGLARPDFPYTRYTQEELNKMYPQVLNENVPTRQTPEETYAKFIAALKTGDLEEASKQFVVGKQKEWLESLEKIKEKGLLNDFIQDYDKSLREDLKSDVSAQYMISIVEAGKQVARPIRFIKDSNGDWKIDSL